MLKKSKQLLAYAHQTVSVEVKKSRRTWLLMNETIYSLQSIPFSRINIVQDFGVLSLQQQAISFHDADVIIMPHGGQMGNSIFCKRKTIILEVACNGYSHLGLTQSKIPHMKGSIPKALGLIHIVVIPCHCDGGDLSEANFKLDAKSIDELLKIVLDMTNEHNNNEDNMNVAGTYYGHRLMGKGCV
jgi:hypothetical protein